MNQLLVTSPGGDPLAVAGGRNADWPPAPPAPHGKEPPGSSPPDTPFSTVLDDHQARTAAAEGHQRDDSPSTPIAERDARTPADRADDGDQDRDADADRTPPAKQDGPPSAALAALLGGVPLPVGVATAVVARLPVAPVSAAPAPTAPASGLPGAPANAAAGTPQPVAIPTGPSVPGAASSLPLGPGVAQPAAGAAAKLADAAATANAPVGDTAAANGRAGAASVADALQAVATRTARLGAGLAAKVAGGAGTATAPATSTAGAPAAPAAAPAGSAHAAAPARGAQAATSAVATVPTAAPASATTNAQGAAAADGADPARGVGLEHAVETVRLALRAAADRGVTHARISLNPRELGSIEVHLRQTADGLVARVVAQHAAAAQLLQDNGADLRRQLEQSGVTLLRLDIGASNDDARRPGERAFAPSAARQSAPDAQDDPLAPTAGTTETTATATLALPNGALVDVLA